MSNELTVEEMKTQGIAYLSSEAYSDLVCMAGHEFAVLPSWSQSYEELSDNELMDVGELLLNAYICTINADGRDYIKRYRSVYTYDEHGDYFGD